MKTMLLLITAAMAAAGCQSSGGGVTLNNTVTACGSGDCTGSNNSANNNTTNQGQGVGGGGGGGSYTGLNGESPFRIDVDPATLPGIEGARCSGNADCLLPQRSDESLVCVSGRCRFCKGKADCGSQNQCVLGACIPENRPPVLNPQPFQSPSFEIPDQRYITPKFLVGRADYVIHGAVSADSDVTVVAGQGTPAKASYSYRMATMSIAGPDGVLLPNGASVGSKFQFLHNTQIELPAGHQIVVYLREKADGSFEPLAEPYGIVSIGGAPIPGLRHFNTLALYAADVATTVGSTPTVFSFDNTQTFEAGFLRGGLPGSGLDARFLTSSSEVDDALADLKVDGQTSGFRAWASNIDFSTEALIVVPVPVYTPGKKWSLDSIRCLDGLAVVFAEYVDYQWSSPASFLGKSVVLATRVNKECAVRAGRQLELVIGRVER